MADTKVTATFVGADLSALGPQFVESLCRRMLVEGGVVLRDAAKANALVAQNKEGVERRGKIANAIYLARDTDNETQTYFIYKVSWNHTKAPHAHWFEYGWWRAFKPYKGSDGNWYTSNIPYDTPKREPARPFLRPAWDNYLQVALQRMMERGQREFETLLQGAGNDSGS